MRIGYLSRIITYFDGKLKDFKDSYLLVENGRIIGITDKAPGKVVGYSDYVILPGFVDTHTHLPQMEVRGKWCPNLLDWLEKYVFPEEMKFQDETYAKDKAESFFEALIKNGTTTAAVFSSPFKRATDIAFEIAYRKGLRIIMGQVMMDRNVPREMRITIEDARRDILDLYSKWHGYGSRLYYAVTPRFALSCSMELMKSLGEIARRYGLYVQTHISEQREEIRRVREMYPEARGYADVYRLAGLLGEKTILAHAVHLTDEDIEILREYDTSVSHCPSSNFFLHSGVMDIQRLKKAGLKIGFGSDIAAGPYFSMLEVARDASYANPISPEQAFYHITLGGAVSLGLESITGSLEMGKSADFIVVDLKNLVDEEANTRDVLSSLIYRGDDRNILATYAMGKRIYEKEKI